MTGEASGSRLVEIGRLCRPWGLKGEQLFLPFNEGGLEFYRRFDELHLDGKPHRVAHWREDGGGRLFIKLDACSTPEEAGLFTNRTAAVPATDLPANPPGVYYEYELIGCRVVDESQRPLGRLEALEEGAGGAGDVMTVVGAQKTILIPFVRRFVKRIDLAERLIVVETPEEEDAV